jgi:hypothetical protein
MGGQKSGLSPAIHILEAHALFVIYQNLAKHHVFEAFQA